MRIHSKTLSLPAIKSTIKGVALCALCLCAATIPSSKLDAAALSISDISANFRFSQNLSEGNTVTPDVSYLQYILNLSGDTQVATTGPGSPDSLTNYFGPKTKAAVRNFQEKFRNEILVPANIANPTGIVGEKTRIKLNQILLSMFAGTYLDSDSATPSSRALAASSASNQAKIFTSNISTSATTNSTASTVKAPPIITLFSTFKALSGQLMSIFGTQFHPTKNTVYLGSVNVGDYTSQDNGTKITFKIPATLETGSYEVGVVNAYGTTSTGFMYLGVVKQAVSTSTTALTFEPTLTTLYPNTSKNMNDLVFLYGENFSFNNTLETNLGNTTVRSTNRKTLSFLISELPYYMEAFKKYKGQSINVIMKVRNENGLSKEQLVHVIQFPNSDSPTVNTTTQSAPASFGIASTTDDAYEMLYRQLGESSTSTKSTNSSGSASTGSNSSSGSGGGSSSGGGGMLGGSSGNMTDPSSMKPEADPLLDQLRQVSPVHKFLSDPLVKNDGGGLMGGGSGSGSGGSGMAGGAAAGIAGGAFGGGSSGGSSGAAGGGAGGSGGASLTDFGGVITQSTICVCSEGLPTLLSIRDVRGSTIQVMYRPGVSSIKQYYNIWTPNVNTLGGMYSGGGACMVGVQPYCSSAGTAQYTVDFIRGIGTSAVPSGGN